MESVGRQEIALKAVLPVRADVNVIQVPCVVKGGLARYLGRVYQEYVRDIFNGNETLLNGIRYDQNKDALTNSHFFSLNVLGRLVRAENPALDVTSYRDLKNPEIERIAREGGHYIDAGDAFVLRNTGKFYDERDRAIFNQLARKIDNLETPVLVSGLKVVPMTKTGRGFKLRVVPTKDFSYTHDAKEFGQEGGWAESDFAISGLYRGGTGLYAGRDLVGAFENGRVVLVSREAGVQDFSKVLGDRRRKELSGKLNNVADYLLKL